MCVLDLRVERGITSTRKYPSKDIKDVGKTNIEGAELFSSKIH